MANHPFPRLFEPLDIRGMRLKNRLVMAPMDTNYAAVGGQVNDRLIDYYAARARGGVGMITVEATAVIPEGRGWEHNLGIWDDRMVPGLRRLAAAIQAGGARAAIEIFHAGRRAIGAIIGAQPVAPSPLRARNSEVPRELSMEEIGQLVGAFASAARRAREAGFDAISLHMAHGYLINQFLSPLSNRRSDAYGRDLRGRTRFASEVIGAVREAVGSQMPIICRLTVDEYTPVGLDLAESRRIAPILVESGADAIDVSAGGPEAPHMTTQPMVVPRGCLVHLAQGIKEVVGVPVAVVGRINTPELAEEILSKGQADLVVMGRALIADPDLPRKALEGKPEDICPCIACNQGCSDRLTGGLDVSCLVNPLVGREGMIEIRLAAAPRKVIVAGGGPAGMSAARTAALRGHRVALYEKGPELGGQALLAAAPPHKDEIANFTRYLIRQMDVLGVEVHLRAGVTPEIVKRERPDVLILATGAVPLDPPIPGEGKAGAIFAWEVLRGGIQVGRRVVVIGGGEVGCETAEYLLERGREVTVVEMLPELAGDMGARSRELLVQRLIRLGVDFVTRAKVLEIGRPVITLERGGLTQTLSGIDTVVLATGSRANREGPGAGQASEFSALVPGIGVIEIGDCVRPRRLLDAVHEGFSAGLRV